MILWYGTVHYGQETIGFRVVYVQRKTLEIAVHPDKAVIVKAPFDTGHLEIEKRVWKRAGWIKRQFDYFRQFEPRMLARSYVGGETHLYLGKQYRLKIAHGECNDIKLVCGYFRISINVGARHAVPQRVKDMLDNWYAGKASIHFNAAFCRCWKPFEKLSMEKPRLHIRRMRTRWGSLSRNGLLTMNINLIRAPKACIDYVITHELCHLRHHDHGPGFYRLLEKMMPDWAKRKAKLELALV